MSIYRCKILTFYEFLSSNLGSENADKFLAVASDGSLKFEDAPEAAQLEARVEALEDDMDNLIKSSEPYDIVANATNHITNNYITVDGNLGSSEAWEVYGIENNGYTSVTYSCYNGGIDGLTMVAFYSSSTISSANLISIIPATTIDSLNTGTVEVPAGTTYIALSNKVASGNCSGTASTQGIIPIMQQDIAWLQREIEAIAGKTVKEGLKIAITGDSISTSTTNRCPEITVMQEDIDAGVQLGAWLTTYDALPMTLGGISYTTADIGKYVTFIPVQEDLGKTVGNESIYNGVGTKVWWEWFQDIGAETINGTYSSGSMCSHESATLERLRTAHGWHDSQIRRLGKRIPGTMKRESPDIIIMYRGCNDMTHSPYAKLTSNYFDGLNWTYPTTDVLSSGFGFKEACSIWVKKLRQAYPKAQIVFATQNNWKRIRYSKFPVDNGDYSLPAFNSAIREIANFFGCETVDFDKDGITFENMYPTYISDSSSIPTHPNNLGHKVMGLKAIMDLDAKLDLFKIEPLTEEGKVAYQIVSNLTDATLSNSDPVYTGDTYTATVTASSIVGDVTVTMGGVIVPNAYNASTGVITVSNVTGDITVSNTVAPVETVVLTQNLTHATSSNTEGTMNKNYPNNVVITAEQGYKIDNVTVTMGGVDITDSSYVYYANDAEVNISNVTDDVTITAVATLVNANYTILKQLQGKAGKCIGTGVVGSPFATVATKIHTLNTVAISQAFGIFGDIFCNIAADYKFSTGGQQTPSTDVTATPNTDYFIKMGGVGSSTSTLEIFAGNDPQMTTRLGVTATRNATASYPFSYLGLDQEDAAGYSMTGAIMYYSYVYDSNNNLIHSYIPAKLNSNNVEGLYDLSTNTFLEFKNSGASSVNVTQNLTHATSSVGDHISTGPANIVITADDGYMIDSITATMGGVDITAVSYEFYPNGAEINIANVTDDITITATTTFVNSDYRVMKELVGQTGKCVDTALAYTSVGSVTAKIHSTLPRHNQGWGYYGYIFCNEYQNTTLDVIDFATGGTSSYWAGVRTGVVPGNRYLIRLENINTATGTLKVYDGLDVGMATLLGSTSRAHGSLNHSLTFVGFNKIEGGTTSYSCTGQPLCWAKVYGSDNTLIRDFIPVTKISTDEQGLYDIVNDTFVGFSSVTQ